MDKLRNTEPSWSGTSGLTHYMKPVRRAALTQSARIRADAIPSRAVARVAPPLMAHLEHDRIPAHRALPWEIAEKRIDRPLQEALPVQPAKIVNPASLAFQICAFFAVLRVFVRHERSSDFASKCGESTWAICSLLRPGTFRLQRVFEAPETGT